MKAFNWEVEEDEFEDDTPMGRKHFTNVIATKDPKAARRVVVAAHFDSKYFESGEVSWNANHGLRALNVRSSWAQPTLQRRAL